MKEEKGEKNNKQAQKTFLKPVLHAIDALI
jgi:hypothetical protein